MAGKLRLDVWQIGKKCESIGGLPPGRMPLTVNIDNEQERSVPLGAGDSKRDCDPVSHTNDTSYI